MVHLAVSEVRVWWRRDGFVPYNDRSITDEWIDWTVHSIYMVHLKARWIRAKEKIDPALKVEIRKTETSLEASRCFQIQLPCRRQNPTSDAYIWWFFRSPQRRRSRLAWSFVRPVCGPECVSCCLFHLERVTDILRGSDCGKIPFLLCDLPTNVHSCK